MIDIQAIVAPGSPTRAGASSSIHETGDDWLVAPRKRRSAFGLLKSLPRFRDSEKSTRNNTLAASDAEKQASLRNIKMQIIKTNPAVYQLLRERLTEKPFFTHWGAAHELNKFLDNDLRMPEVREEIMSHHYAVTSNQRQASSSTRSAKVGLLAYLKTSAPSTPPLRKRRTNTSSSNATSPSSSSTLKSTISFIDEASVQRHSLIIPSLDSTTSKGRHTDGEGGHDDDEKCDDSCFGNSTASSSCASERFEL